MGSEGHTFHILFFPLMAQGHMLPMIDIAKLFAARGVVAIVLTTRPMPPSSNPRLTGIVNSATSRSGFS